MRNQKCLGIINNCFIPCQSCRLNGTDTKALGRLHKCQTGVETSRPAEGEGRGLVWERGLKFVVFVATAFVSFCWHLIKTLANVAPYTVRWVNTFRWQCCVTVSWIFQLFPALFVRPLLHLFLILISVSDSLPNTSGYHVQGEDLPFLPFSLYSGTPLQNNLPYTRKGSSQSTTRGAILIILECNYAIAFVLPGQQSRAEHTHT